MSTTQEKIAEVRALLPSIIIIIIYPMYSGN